MQVEIKTESVTWRHEETTCHGHLAIPAGTTGRRPAVLVGPEWWGLNQYAKDRAEQLAKSGYVALAIDMFGDGRITGDPKVASEWASTTRTGALSRSRSTRALEFLRNHPAVDADRVAGVGFCFGGSVMLELARNGAPVRAVTSFHGSLATPSPAKKGTLRAAILVLTGADDPYVSEEELRTFKSEMQEAGADWEMCLLGNAVHSFSNPDADAAKLPGIAYNEPAARRGWQKFNNFLAETVGT
jgi:dienelactone hydrolase